MGSGETEESKSLCDWSDAKGKQPSWECFIRPTLRIIKHTKQGEPLSDLMWDNERQAGVRKEERGDVEVTQSATPREILCDSSAGAVEVEV